jgi:lipopolysaccharide export system permease protein
MSALLAIIMSISTLNSDHEVMAMRAGGMRYSRMFRPYFIFGIFLSLFMVWYQFQILPLCTRGVDTISLQIYNYNPTAAIEPGQFTLLNDQEDKKSHIFVEDVVKDPNTGNDILKGVQVRKTELEDRFFKITELIIAEKGIKVIKKTDHQEPLKTLRLFNGYIFTNDDKEQTFQRVDFTKGYMDIHLRDASIEDIDEKKEFNAQELNFIELIDSIDIYKKEMDEGAHTLLIRVRTEFHKRIALPVAVVLFLFLGFPMGIVNKRSGKGLGFGQSVIFIFVYFSIFLSTDAIAMRSVFISPMLAAWLGNIVLFILASAIYLFKTSDVVWENVFSLKR